MENFNFISPTKIIFGKDSEDSLIDILKEHNYKNIAICYGKNSIKANGLYDKIVKILKNNNISFYEISNIEPNPKLSKVIEAINYLKDKNIELLLAIGGGSVIDTCKLISHAMYYDNNPFDFISSNVKDNTVIPVGVILTISASGSELSDSCVITNDLVTPFIKKGFNRNSNRPLFAICNPTLTFSVSKFQTACGIVDILSHTLERFFNVNDKSQIADNLSLSILKTVLDNGLVAYINPNNYEARANLMLASSYSHNGLTGIGKKQFMRIHGMEHALSGLYDSIYHGEGLSILMIAYFKYIKDVAKDRFDLLSKYLFDGKDFISELTNYFVKLNMPIYFDDLDEDIDIDKLALVYSKNKTLSFNDYKVLDYNSFIEICNLARR